jgi:hypothetical protein
MIDASKSFMKDGNKNRLREQARVLPERMFAVGKSCRIMSATKSTPRSSRRWSTPTPGGERLRTYDYVVANPPFSDKTWSTGIIPEKDTFKRFEWGRGNAEAVIVLQIGDFAWLTQKFVLVQEERIFEHLFSGKQAQPVAGIWVWAGWGIVTDIEAAPEQIGSLVADLWKEPVILWRLGSAHQAIIPDAQCSVIAEQ